MLKFSIVSIGDEVRIGQVINSNAAWLANEITKLGGFVSNHITIGDDFDQMENILHEQLDDNDIIITTGGLGPTHDDITKPVLLKLFNDKLVFDQPSYENIVELFTARERKISERNRLQAYIPELSIPLKNALGTAPGLMYELTDNKYLFALPGVPSEMKYITENSILPIISKLISDNKYPVVLYKTLQTAGIFESNLADEVGNVDEFLGNSSLAFLPSFKGIRLRIGTHAENFEDAKLEIDRIKKVLYQKIGKYIFAEDDTDLTLEIGKYLSNKKHTLSVAESCTGGGLGEEFTRIPGASNYFVGGIISYSNEVKINQLNVSPETLKKFGAVSKETALEMAQNCRIKFDTDYSIAITGIAGPDGGTADKPVGTVWIAVSGNKGTKAFRFLLGKEREIVRDRAIHSALLEFYKYILFK